MTDGEKLDRIAAFGGREGVDRKALDLLSALVSLRIEAKKRIRVQPVSSEVRKERLSEGEPLLHREDLVLDLSGAVRYWYALEKLLREHGEAVEAVPDPEGFIREFLEKGQGLRGVHHFMVLEVLKPLYEAHAEVYGKQLDDAQWTRPYCYVCGSPPDMAVLRGDGGKRYLYCRLCDTEWWYARLKCPFCSNEDAEKLVSLSLESDPASMIHACTACNRYLKVFDARLHDDLFLELEDLRTAHLDELARTEGFARD